MKILSLFKIIFIHMKIMLYAELRGWISPDSDKFTDHDGKIYARELIRLRLSLDMAKKEGYSKFIVMIHYPPSNESYDESEFIKIFKEYNVEKVIYGHLHGPAKVKIKN